MIFNTHMVSIKPNFFTTYIKRDSTADHPTNLKEWAPLPTENKSHGLLSVKANKRVRLAIDWLIYLSKEKKSPVTKKAGEFNFQLNFITLTLCSKQKHSDSEIKSKLLNQFLTELRQKYNAKNYMWRAESQANGNIHFHVVSDVFVPWRALRTDWNRIQEKLGYCTSYTARTNKVDPNSTDVHAIKAVRNLSAYLAKYCSKNSKGYVVMCTKAQAQPFAPPSWLTYKFKPLQKKAKFYRQIHGKLWGLSQTLSKLNSAKREVTGIIQQEIEWLQNKFKNKVKYFDFSATYTFSAGELIKKKCFALADSLRDHYNSVINPPPKENPQGILSVVDVITQPIRKLFQSKLQFN
jgi:hypothetical protein